MEETDEANPVLDDTERLSALLYQFTLLYERWSEDRQVVMKQSADTAKHMEALSKQVEHFKHLEAEVRQTIVTSIHQASERMAKTVGDAVNQGAMGEMNRKIQAFNQLIEETQHVLATYQRQVATYQWKVIITTVVTTLLAALLIVKLILPTPILPLTEEQMKDLYGGHLMTRIWPKLSKEEKEHWGMLANEVRFAETKN